MNTVKKYKFNNGYELVIKYALDPENPRLWQNHSYMICFHSKYILGDINSYSYKDFNTWDDLRSAIQNDYNNPEILLNLYLFDHSGLCLSINSELFRNWDPQGWDWGQVGFVFITNKVYKETFKKLREFAIKSIEDEIKIYNHYLNGQVFYWSLFDQEHTLLDTLGDFYGVCDIEDSEILESLPLDVQKMVKQKEYNEVHSKDTL